jgi:hypothetical protein
LRFFWLESGLKVLLGTGQIEISSSY